jgi:hypothetical protein
VHKACGPLIAIALDAFDYPGTILLQPSLKFRLPAGGNHQCLIPYPDRTPGERNVLGDVSLKIEPELPAAVEGLDVLAQFVSRLGINLRHTTEQAIDLLAHARTPRWASRVTRAKRRGRMAES